MTLALAPLPALLIAISVGYVLGALPIADRISRFYGVDIFSTGTGLAGSSNVRRNVGKRAATMVLIGDVTKGVVTVLLANQLIGVQGSWLILPSLAAILGHWRSVFTGFRGGDGNAILAGIIVALFPVYALIAIFAGVIVGLGARRLHYSSLLNIVAGYTTLAALVVTYGGDVALALGVGGLSCMVLAYAMYGHRQRRRGSNAIWDDLDDSDNPAEQPDFKS